MPLALLTLLKNNLPVLFALAIIGGAFFYGKHEGSAATKARWTAALQTERNAAQLAKDHLQFDADKKAGEYEEERQQRIKNQRATDRRLADEKAKNSAFATCHAGDEFLRIYGAAGDSAPGAAGESASQPNR